MLSLSGWAALIFRGHRQTPRETDEEDEGDCVLHPASIVQENPTLFSTDRQRPFADRSDNALIVPSDTYLLFDPPNVSPDLLFEMIEQNDSKQWTNVTCIYAS